MIRIVFVGPDGVARPAAGEADARLLDVAQAAGEPLEGACNGDMACATCHVIVAAEDFAKLPPAPDGEEDLLDLVPGATRTSRLACQIRLAEALDGLTVRVPA